MTKHKREKEKKKKKKIIMTLCSICVFLIEGPIGCAMLLLGGLLAAFVIGVVLWFLQPEGSVERKASRRVVVGFGFDHEAQEPRPKVCVIGAGAAGMAATFSLMRAGFDVSVVDEAKVCGGVATSETLEDGQLFNDGVQGGARNTYANVLELHRVFGFEPSNTIPLNVAFGLGSKRWTNYSSDQKVSQSMQRMAPEIKAFSALMERVYNWGNIFMLIDIVTLLRVLQYSSDFVDHYVLALTALFFGTGNQTRAVPAAVVARVFCDPEFAIFRLDPARFIGKSADFFAFSSLRKIYGTMRDAMERDGVKFFLGNKAVGVNRSPNGCKVVLESGVVIQADYIVFACPAPVALKILGSEASTMEKWALSGVKLFKDVTYTHRDEKYMRDQV
jgi:predicted NAD/FAD-binding protein